jgi:hypothetical protein
MVLAEPLRPLAVLNRLVPVIAFSARQRCLKLVTLPQHAVQIVLPLVHHHLFKVHV